MAYFIVLVVVVLLICAVAKLASGNRYKNMTSAEFGAEAKHVTGASGAIAALQKVIDPGHHVEYLQEQKEREEEDAARSGDRPETGSSDRLKENDKK